MSNFELTLAFEACKHYDKIVNYNYNEDDKLTDFIIQKYKEFVFSAKEKQDLEKLTKIDEAVNEYVTNHKFYTYINSLSALKFEEIDDWHIEFKLADTREIKITDWL